MNIKEIEEVEILTTAYSPAALVAILSKAFMVPEEKKVIQIKGIFLKQGTTSYSGFFYNKLKDEASDHTITLITSSLVHNQLRDNTTIVFNGYLTRKADKFGRIEFQINFIELVNTSPNKYSDEDIKKMDIINLKLKAGFKDLDSLVKSHIYNNIKIKVAVILGKSAIIDQDIIKSLAGGSVHYDITYHRVSIASSTEIAIAIQHFDESGVDFICVARGGGELLEAFEQTELAEIILNLNKPLASAIGHANDVTLFEKIADKKFITPTALGTYLKDIVNETVEELSKSKAKMQKDITDNLKTIYDGEIKNLNIKLENTTKLHSEEKKGLIELHQRQIENLNKTIETSRTENNRIANQLNEARKVSSPKYGVIIVIIAIAIIIIIALSRK